MKNIYLLSVLLCCCLNFTFGQCGNIGQQSGTPAAATCGGLTFNMGPGSWTDFPVTANTWYTFTLQSNTSNGASVTTFTAYGGANFTTVLANSTGSGVGANLTVNSGSNTVIRISTCRTGTWAVTANTCNCFTNAQTSAVLNYRLRNPGAVSVSSGSNICSGSTLSLSGGGNGTIYWQGTTNNGTATNLGSGSTSPAITAAGTYYARARDNATNCWGVQGSTAVTIKPGPTGVTATASPTAICNGTSTQLSGSATGPTVVPGSTSATFSSGNGSTEYNTGPTQATNSACPINLSVNIPAGAVITGVNVSYNFTATNGAWLNEQRSYLECTSTGGSKESTIFSQGTGVGGTQTFTRNNLNIANNVSGGGTINFRLHAFRTWGGSGCNVDFNFIVNNTFTITVLYNTPAAVTYSWISTPAGFTSSVQNPGSVTPPSTGNYVYQVTATSNGCSVSATSATVAVTNAASNPATFPSNQWNFYAYNGGNISLNGVYSGFYPLTGTINYDTRNQWADNLSPSNATGWAGCGAVPVDNHAVSAKRQGFPCGVYQLNITNHDDDIRVFVNGSQVFDYVGCCTSHSNIWTGYLSSSSQVEVRHLEGVGGSHQGLEFVLVNPTLNGGTIGGITNDVIICNNTDPGAFTNTGTPTGGTIGQNGAPPAPTYQWESSTTSAVAGWGNASSTGLTFDPSTLTQTTWFRRRVTDACGTVAYSNVIRVEVRTALNPGAIVTTGQTICSGGDPSNISNQTAASGGDGSYTYEWRAGSTPQAGSNTQSFDPAPGLTSTTTYTRWVRDAGCTGFTQSTGSWIVTVNSITASGSIAGNQTICNGGDPAAFTSGGLATGSGTISYRWEWSESPFSSWNNIVGATSSTYDVPSGLTTTRQYRRIPVSLLNSVSCDGTPPATVQVTVQSIPTNNSISGNQTICNGGDPAAFSSSGAGTGDGSITYQWQSSVSPFSSWNDIGSATNATYDHGTLTVTTQFRRQTVSTLNSVACRSTGTTPVTVTVQSTVGAGTIATAQTICNGATPAPLTSSANGTGSGSIAYRWQFSTTSSTTGFSDAGASTQGFSPGSLTQTTWYRRYTQSTQNSVMCESTSPTTAIQITVQAIPTAGAIQTTRFICNNTTATIGNVTAGTTASTGGTLSYRWEESTTSPSSGFATVPSATANNYTTPTLTADRWYRRYTVYTLNSVACESTSPTAVTQVDVQSVPTANAITGGETICNGGNPVAFGSSGVGTGDGAITYRWERADAPGFDVWTNIGASTETYDAPNGLTVTRQYRRLTVSTEGGNACNSLPTNTVQVTVQSVVNAGAIAADQTICNGNTPAALTSQTNGSGDNITGYRWQSSTTSAISGFSDNGETSAGFAPSALTQTTWYRRYAQSTLNSVMCESAASAVVQITVQGEVTAGAIAADQTICYNTAPTPLSSTTNGDGTGSISYIWEVSSTDAVSGFATVPSETASTLSLGALTSNRWYRRRTLSTQNSVGCESSNTSVVGITVRPQFTTGAIATTGQTICTSLDPANIASVTPASGGDNAITYEWRANGNPLDPSNSSNYDPAVNTVNVNTTFTRWAKDNTCNTSFAQSTGSWVVTINNPSTVTTLNNGDFVWTGNTNTAWNTNTNWLQRSGGNFVTPGSAPNANTANVIIPQSGTCVSTNNASIGLNTVSVNNLTVESGRTFTLNNFSSVLNIAGTLNINGTWGVPAAGSTVVFNGSGNQNIPVLAYSNLSTANGGTKSLTGNTIVAGVLNIGASTTFDAGSHSLTLPFIGGAPSIPLVNNGIFNAGTGLVNYSGAGNQTIAGVVYNNLTTSGSGNKSLGGATEVGSTLNLTAGTLVVGTNTFTMNGSTINRTSGSIDASNLGATLVFNNGSLLTLPTNVFSAAVNNMTLSNSRVKAQSDFTVNGTLNLNASNPDATDGLLDLVTSYGGYAGTRSENSTDAANNLNSVVLTMGPNATTSGGGDVTGKIRRTSITDGVGYSFGNSNMVLTFDQNGGTLPSQVTVVATRGDQGLHVDKDGTNDYTPNTADTLIGNAAVKRLWQVLRTGGTSEVRFTVRFPYQDSELNGNTESNLVTWDHHIPYGGLTPHEHGKTSASTGDNYVELSNHGLFYLALEGDASFTKYWMLSQKISLDTLWLGAAGGASGNDWGAGINWTSGAIPINNTKVIIDPDVYKSELKVDGTRYAGSILIKDGGVLNGEDGTLIVTGGPQSNGGLGSWVNQGTFNPGTSTVVFDNVSATLSGENKFYNLTVNSGKTLTIQANAVDTILNVLTNNGTLNASSNANTMVFAGENQYIPIPNGGTASYHSLTIAQQNSATAIAEGPLELNGNLLISSGTLDMEFTNPIDIKGDLIINGALFGAPNVTLNGNGAQQIGGTTPNSFFNLTMSGNAATVTLNQDIYVEGELNVGNGKTLNAGSRIVELRNSGDPWILAGSFTPGTSTVKYLSTDPANIVGTTYHNLESQGATTKTATGNITVNNDLTLDETTLDLVSYDLSLKGLNITSGGQIEASDADVTFVNTSTLTLPSGTFVSAVKDLTLNGGGNITSAGDLTLNGTLAMTNGNLDMGSNTLTMEPTSTWTSATGSLDATDAKIVFKSPTFAVGVLNSPVVKDLEFDRAAGIDLTGNLEVSGEFKLTDGTLDVSTHTLRLSGDMIHIGGSVDVDNGTIEFNNGSNWSLPSAFFAGDAKNVRLIGNGGIGLGASLRVSNTLDLANGKIETSDANLLELGTGVNSTADVIWSTTSNARVVGPVKRWYGTGTNQSAEKGVIPIGNDDFNRSVQINFNQASSGGYIMAEYIEGLPDNNYELPLTYFTQTGLRKYIQNADQTGYWSMTPFNAAGTPYASLDDVPYKIKVRINNPDAVANGNNLPDPPTMRIIRAKGNPTSLEHEDWAIGTADAVISAVTPPSNSNFDYMVEATLTGFSWFNVGGDNSTPLPVELLSFSGSCTNEGNLLKWRTASENQSASFEVERSRDGISWNVIGSVPAAGFSMQELSYVLVDQMSDDLLYYRLKQIDINGDSRIYDPILVTCTEMSNSILTYPNPSGNQFSLVVNDEQFVGISEIVVTDTKGAEVTKKNVKMENGQNVIFFNEALTPGVYYIRIFNGKISSEVIKHVVR
jgi:hypothetical protein